MPRASTLTINVRHAKPLLFFARLSEQATLHHGDWLGTKSGGNSWKLTLGTSQFRRQQKIKRIGVSYIACESYTMTDMWQRDKHH